MTERVWAEGMPTPTVVADILARADRAGYDALRLTAVHIGGCIDAYGTVRVGAMRRSAHAHTHAKDKHRGAVCFKGGERKMTHRLVAHEVAHVLTHAGHTAEWRRAVTALGHPKEASRYPARKGNP